MSFHKHNQTDQGHCYDSDNNLDLDSRLAQLLLQQKLGIRIKKSLKLGEVLFDTHLSVSN